MSNFFSKIKAGLADMNRGNDALFTQTTDKTTDRYLLGNQRRV